jgi:hypothetical protein
LIFPGPDLELCLAHVGEAVALLAVIPKGRSGEALALIPTACADLRRILIQIGVPAGPADEPPQPAARSEEIVEGDPAAAQELAELLSGANEHALTAEEIDAFWETSERNMNTGSLNPDDLSFDQARKIGLAPDEE